MATKLEKLWKALNKDIREFWHPADVVASGADVSKAIVDCAIPLGLLGLPFAAIAPQVSAGLLFVGLGAKALKFYHEKGKDALSLEEGVALAAQLAYLESFGDILTLSDNKDLVTKIGQNQGSEAFKKQVEKLAEFELTEQQAKQTIKCFHESELAKAFNDVLSARLVEAGLRDDEAKIFALRVSWNTHRYLSKALSEAGNAVKQLSELYRNRWQKDIEKYDSIDNYLQQQIATKPLETVFAESFTFKDIYVPLKAQPVNSNGDIDNNASSFDLEGWVKKILLDTQKQDKVIFIQGGPGRGKSVFCRMFADWVRQNFHPIWTPILIRLQDIRNFERNFEKTLQAAVGWDFATSDDGWLTDSNTRYLFLLDGFDELLMERGTSQGLKDFLWQVEDFQGSCKRNPEKGHRVLITGRQLALQGIEGRMPPNLERVELLPMDDKIQQQWFAQWETLFGKDKTSEFEKFLRDSRCPHEVWELAKEPLLLYLLAAMHRDGQLAVEMFEGATSIVAKIKIYQQFLDWVLTKQREEWLNRELTGMETEVLRSILAEAGLCVVQSGGECAKVKMIEERLKGNNDNAIQLIKQARGQQGNDALKNALAVFYLNPATGDKEGSVEFAHKSFSEFLCAERLKESIEDWTRPGIKGKEFYISSEVMDGEIYDLLGYGGLTQEIVEYLMALLTVSDEFHPLHLFKRLENFYLRWCNGEFIDAPPNDNLPQKKMLQLQERDIKLGIRQVDVYAGLNVMILLLELHHYAQSKDDLKDKINFYLCGQKDTAGFEETRLLRIISYSNCFGIGVFNQIVGSFLSGVNLSGANLSNANLSFANFIGANLIGANLIGANLISADLIGANLSRADLIGANLSRANLIGANLSRANLDGANLIGADLSDANLSDANLSRANLSRANLIAADLSDANLSDANLSRANLSLANLIAADLSDANLIAADLSDANLIAADLSDANLSRANLSRANLSLADLENITWDENTNWDNIYGLQTAKNVPEALKKQLGIA